MLTNVMSCVSTFTKSTLANSQNFYPENLVITKETWCNASREICCTPLKIHKYDIVYILYTNSFTILYASDNSQFTLVSKVLALLLSLPEMLCCYYYFEVRVLLNIF